MSKETDAKKSEIIQRLYEINTGCSKKSTEPIAALVDDEIILYKKDLNTQDRKALVGVLCDWYEQRMKKHTEDLGVEKKELENELKGLL